MSNRFYQNMWMLAAPPVRFLHRMEIQGLENLPTDRPVLLCANHSHALDPVLLASAMPKTTRLRIMAKKQLFSIPVLGKAISKLGAFPVDRGNSDIGAVKNAIQSLRDGYHLMVFPEGTRVIDPEKSVAKPGVAMIAIRAGVELLPVFIDRDKMLFRKVRVIFGKPYAPVYTGRRGTAEEYQENAEEILRRIYALGGAK